MYPAFANVPKPRAIEGCPCCIEGKEIDKLLITPLREMSPKELASYASSALPLSGALPTISTSCRGIWRFGNRDTWWPDVEVTGRAIHSSKPDSWKDWYRNALKVFPP